MDITHHIENSLFLCLPKQRWCPTWNLQCYHLVHLPEETLNPLQIGNFSLFVGDFLNVFCFHQGTTLPVNACEDVSEAHKK